MKIFYDTIPNHLVSGKEKHNLKLALETQDIEIVKSVNECDVYVFKAFYKDYNQIKGIKKPIIMQAYGVNWRKGINIEAQNKKLKEVYPNVDCIVYMSEFAKRLTEHYFGYPEENTEVIWNSQKVDFPEQNPLMDGFIKCATTAVWRDWKRLHETERLVKKWNETHIKNRIELFIAGKDGESEDQNIHYMGFKNEFEYYKNMHFFLYPSLMETFGNTVAEAIAYGLPCMITNYGAPAGIIGEAGIVLNNEPEELLNFSKKPVAYGPSVPPVKDSLFEIAMMNLIENYPRYRENARKQAEKFSYEVIGNQWRELLNELKLNYYKKQ